MKMQCRDADGFEGPIQVTSSYMDIGYKGYSWRILVRADPELHMLRKLQKPTPEAASLLRVSVMGCQKCVQSNETSHTFFLLCTLQVLTREHVVSAMHHSMIHAIHTLHPSSGSVVRLAKRWTASHLLSDLIPFEAIELLVAKVYTNRDVPLDPPSTVVSGFLRFLHLLASHDWTRYVLDELCIRSTTLRLFELTSFLSLSLAPGTRLWSILTGTSAKTTILLSSHSLNRLVAQSSRMDHPCTLYLQTIVKGAPKTKMKRRQQIRQKHLVSNLYTTQSGTCRALPCCGAGQKIVRLSHEFADQQ